MKLKHIFFLIILMSCNDSTGPKIPPFDGELFVKGGSIEIKSNKDSINIKDTFSIVTNLRKQKYRINGRLILNSQLMFEDSLIILLSPEAKTGRSESDTAEKRFQYRSINIELFPENSFSQQWSFKLDSNRIINSRYKDGGSFSFQAIFQPDSVLLDMDTLYGGPGRPVPVKEKRWYNLQDSLDFRILSDLGFDIDSYIVFSKTISIYVID